MITSVLYYVHDPMCSWCYGFKPTWAKIQGELPSIIKVKYLIGGLAPDSDQPMPAETQAMIKGAWQRIHDMLGTEFNFDFWQKNTPRRSTYPACRAVIAAKAQHREQEMIAAIQQGYYRRALNPSDDHILIQIASELEIDINQFKSDLSSDETQIELQRQILLSRNLTQHGFPSLVLKHNGICQFIQHDYQHPDITLNKINQILNMN